MILSVVCIIFYINRYGNNIGLFHKPTRILKHIYATVSVQGI